MKKIIISLLVIFPAAILILINYGTAKNNDDNMQYSFYKVPLVCSAAPSIGCGIKSKPILQQLEKNNNVAEAWLNSTGTIIAVIWKHDVNIDERVKTTQTIFKEQNIEAEEIAGNEYEVLTKDFELKQNWLRNTDVDKLSGIEAKEIAQRLVDRVNVKTPLSKEVANKLHDQTAEIINTAFTTMDVSEINKQPESVMDECKQKIVDDILSKAQLILNEAQLNAFKNAIYMGITPVEGEAGYFSGGCCDEMSKTTEKKCSSNGKEACSDNKK